MSFQNKFQVFDDDYEDEQPSKSKQQYVPKSTTQQRKPPVIGDRFHAQQLLQ
jgi:hypothetical protein